MADNQQVPPPPPTPMTSDELLACVNRLELTPEQFTAFLQGAVLLAERNSILAKIAKAQADQQTANAAVAATVSALQAQLTAVDAQYQQATTGA